MGWQILVFYPESEDSMNYFDSDMSKSTNTVVYFDWKTAIYIYVADKVAHNLCYQIRADDNSSTCTFTTGKSITCTGECANEIIPN
jgi:hypothetical protein